MKLAQGHRDDLQGVEAPGRGSVAALAVGPAPGPERAPGPALGRGAAAASRRVTLGVAPALGSALAPWPAAACCPLAG